MEMIPYNSEYGLYCEDCGWVACFSPERLPVGSLCKDCGHELGTSGYCYDYTAGQWYFDRVEGIYGQ